MVTDTLREPRHRVVYPSWERQAHEGTEIQVSHSWHGHYHVSLLRVRVIRCGPALTVRPNLGITASPDATAPVTATPGDLQGSIPGSLTTFLSYSLSFAGFPATQVGAAGP